MLNPDDFVEIEGVLIRKSDVVAIQERLHHVSLEGKASWVTYIYTTGNHAFNFRLRKNEIMPLLFGKNPYR